MADSDFVGRNDELAQILGDVGGPGRTGIFFDIEGIPGIGKTRLIEQLAKLTKLQGVAVRIDCSDFELRGSRTRPASLDEDAELRQFRLLLRGTLQRLPDNERITDVLNYLTDYSQASQSVRPTDFIHDPDEVLDGQLPPRTTWTRTSRRRGPGSLCSLTTFIFLRGARSAMGHQVAGRHQGRRCGRYAPGVPWPGWPGNAGACGPAVARQPQSRGRRDVPQDQSRNQARSGRNRQSCLGFHRRLPASARARRGPYQGERKSRKAVQRIRQLAAVQGGRAAQLDALVNRIMETIDDVGTT